MLDTERPTHTTGGRTTRGLSGNDPRTAGSRYHLESRVRSEIQGDNNLLRPLFKSHFCRYHLEGIQVNDGGWQVALIGAYSST